MSPPLTKLERLILTDFVKIEYWFRKKFHDIHVPLYSSIDLRNSYFKLAPVDMNLFSAGFNNIDPNLHILATQALQYFFERNFPDCQKILLIIESHTRNLAYLDNIIVLKNIFIKAGFSIEISSLDNNINGTTISHNNEQITYQEIFKQGNKLVTKSNFCPDIIVLNNDLSSGIPEILSNIEQKILPPLNAGWHKRRKNIFFKEYNKICNEFAQLLNIDPWLISTKIDVCKDLNFKEKIGIDELATKAEKMLNDIYKKYQEHNINEKPYLVIKADNGTYGMGIMIVKSVDDILLMNRKSRNKMAVIKDKQFVTEVLIQEGIRTAEIVNNQVAEPVIYTIDYSVIGGFYRVHSKKGDNENLNAPGADFIPIAFANDCLPKINPNNENTCNLQNCANRFYIYGIFARLSLLASANELMLY